jgi:hypothetical protein
VSSRTHSVRNPERANPLRVLRGQVAEARREISCTKGFGPIWLCEGAGQGTRLPVLKSTQRRFETDWGHCELPVQSDLLLLVRASRRWPECHELTQPREKLLAATC